MNPFTNNPQILLVDDDKIIQSIGHTLLTESNFDVVSARSGEEALAMLGELEPDLILLDIIMPGATGFEICAEIKSLPKLSDIPIIMLTGNDDVESVELAYSNGAWDFTSKPINWPILAKRCHHTIAAHQGFKDAKKSAGLALALDNSNNLIFELDLETLYIKNVNEHGLKLLDYRSDELQGLYFGSLLKDADHSSLTKFKRLSPGRSQLSITGEILSRDQTCIPFDGLAVRSALKNEEVLMVIIQDITEKSEQQKTIHRLEYFDELTQLPNMRWLKSQYEAQNESVSNRPQQVWLSILDIDGLRKINESLGYEAGNHILTHSASRLAEQVVKINAELQRDLRTINARLSLARQSGDEFLVLITGIETQVEISDVLDRLVAAFYKPVFVNGHELTITTSVGVALKTIETDNFDTMIKNSEAAMYKAKAAGKNTIRFLTQENKKSGQAALLSMESQLRRAIETDQLSMKYQPQIDSRSGELKGVEALIRWDHPTQGWVSPGVFIPLAEETSLMLKLGEWVAQCVFKDAEDWLCDLIGTECEISLNVSSKQLQDDSFLEIMGRLSRSYSANNQMVIELTESSVASDINRHMHNLNGLKRLGFDIAIDDFGTGYSSLSYLKDLPVDCLKVDQSFVKNIENPADFAIVKVIFELAKSLDLRVIAEGVETQAQFDALKSLGSFLSQGFKHSKALDALELKEFVRKLAVVNSKGIHLKPELAALDKSA